MFDAYKVAVKLTLVSDMARELRSISGMFKNIGKEADGVKLKIRELNLEMKKLKMVAAGSAAMALGGWFGLKAVKSSMGPGMEYAHQLNIMTMHGMKQQELAEATATAWKITGEVLTTTATQNLKTILDLKNVFGHSHEAIAYAPSIAKLGAVMASASEGKLKGDPSKMAEDIGFAVAKALDIRNAVGNVGEFNREATAMGKVVTAYQNRITPEDFRMVFKYGRQAIPGLSNEFLYEQLPTFMLEMKGKSGGGAAGGFGTSLAAFYRFFVQGIMSKPAMAHLQELGLLPAGAGIKTTTTGTMLAKGAHIKGVELAQSNQFEYVQKVLLPAIRAKYGDVSNQKLALIIGDIMRGSAQTAIFATQQYAFKAQNVYRDQQIVKGAMNADLGYKQSLSADPYLAIGAFNAQMDNLKTAFTMGIIPFVIPAIISFTEHLNEFADWARNHPDTAKKITIGIAAVGTAMVVFGTVIGIKTAFAIMRTQAALVRLNETLLATAGAADAAAGGGAAAGGAAGVAKKAGLLASAGRFGMYGLLGLAAYSWGDTLYEASKNLGKASGPADDETAGLRKGVVNLYVDGRQLASTVATHLADILHMSQWSTPSQFNPSKSPTVAGATAPR